MRSVVAVVLGEEVSHEMRVKEGVVAEVEQNLHQVGWEEEEEEVVVVNWQTRHVSGGARNLRLTPLPHRKTGLGQRRPLCDLNQTDGKR